MITYFIKKKIGKEWHSFSVQGSDLHDVLMQAKKLSFDNMPECGLCRSDDLELSAHTTEDKGFDYAYIRCKKCKATLNFGQQKKDKETFYYKTVNVDGQDGRKIKYYDWRAFEPKQQ